MLCYTFALDDRTLEVHRDPRTARWRVCFGKQQVHDDDVEAIRVSREVVVLLVPEPGPGASTSDLSIYLPLLSLVPGERVALDTWAVRTRSEARTPGSPERPDVEAVPLRGEVRHDALGCTAA